MAPLQFKGEIMDFDLGIEIDHRKRRRNRTTQSCLNCHTSKRKCDRKRPCQRCIQLGLTGLCVYEVDDPAARDDPNIDETTRLRNRIAELESLVRELRGKPHPRWAEPNFCDGDASEKWHSRSTRRQALFQRQRQQAIDGSQASPVVKTEPSAEQQSQAQQPQLYRMSPSPQPQLTFAHGDCGSADHLHYSPASSSSSISYPHTRQSSLSMSATDVYYHQPYMRSPESAAADASCSCLTNPAAGAPLISLTHQLQSTIELLRQLPEHATRHSCLILKRISQLNDLMHGGSGESTPSSTFDALSTPESELLSPVSTSSHSSLANTIPADWPAIAAPPSQYDSYFPVSPGDPGMYHKGYHIN